MKKHIIAHKGIQHGSHLQYQNRKLKVGTKPFKNSNQNYKISRNKYLLQRNIVSMQIKQ